MSLPGTLLNPRRTVLTSSSEEELVMDPEQDVVHRAVPCSVFDPSNPTGGAGTSSSTMITPEDEEAFQELLQLVGESHNAEDLLEGILITRRETVWYPGDSYNQAKKMVIPGEVLERWAQNGLDIAATLRFSLPVDDGYWFELPKPGDSVLDAPIGRTTVFLEHLECGLRFPLHPFIESVLLGYNISLFQLHPMAFRRLLSFVFVCEVMGFECSLPIWRCMFQLQKRPGGIWTFQQVKVSVKVGGGTVERKYTTTFPMIESYGRWWDRFLFMRVPRAVEHPALYRAPTVFTEPQFLPPLLYSALSPLQRSVVDHFEAGGPDISAVSNGPVPQGWVPHFDFLKREDVLAVAGLSRSFPDSKSGGKSLESVFF